MIKIFCNVNSDCHSANKKCHLLFTVPYYLSRARKFYLTSKVGLLVLVVVSLQSSYPINIVICFHEELKELQVCADNQIRGEEGMPRRSWLAGPWSHWEIYRGGQRSNGRTVGPNQIGSDRGPDCPQSIWGKEVRGRVQKEEGVMGVCKDSKGDEWANGIMLEAPFKGMTEGCDLCGEAGWNWTVGTGKWCWVLADVA